MAKKNAKNAERRAVAERLRQQQARKERTRSMLILGLCVVVVAGLLVAALVPYLKDRAKEQELAGKSVASIGATASAAQCTDIETRKTDHSQQHIPAPTPITYTDAPPSFGAHRPQSASFERNFYTAQDRPEVPLLVHNLEHGYVIAWYDDTLAGQQDEVDQLEAIADKYKSANVRFIAAPWTASDGAAFPDGKHLALTRWSADAEDPGNQDKQRGNWQYCARPSGAVISDFVSHWTNDQSPEPGIM